MADARLEAAQVVLERLGDVGRRLRLQRMSALRPKPAAPAEPEAREMEKEPEADLADVYADLK